MPPTLSYRDARVVRDFQFLWANFLAEGMSAAAALASTPMTAARRQLGQRAEDLVAARLTTAGWKILARNARTRYGELDLVGLDGDALVFVEVKAGRADSDFGPERPVLSVDFRKQRRVRRLATAWLGEQRRLPPYAAIRFDAIGVSFDRGGEVAEFEHLEAAF
jgi:putative endonuclease